MSELTTTSSGYATGSIDTWSNQANDPSGNEIRAEHVNGLGSAIVQIETILGDGTSLKGSKADLATRLAVQMLSNGIINPIGSIQMYGGASAPTGFLLCDGTAVSRTTYIDLFGVIGTAYGTGDGSTTFNVPDLRGRSPVGVGSGGTGSGSSGTGLPTGGLALTTVNRGTWKGEENHTLTTTETPIPAHTHTYTNATIGVTTNSNISTGGATTTAVTDVPGGSASTGSTTAAAGSAFNVIQPVMGVNFIVKF